MTHEKKSRHQHFQNKKEDEGDGLLAASHRIFNNSVSIQNSNMASSSKEVMPLSSSSSLSSAESKVSFSSADCSVSSRHGNVITGENTRHHHLLYHSYYKSSSSTSFSPPRHEVPSSSSANPECSEMYNFGHENSRYTVDRIRQQRLFNVFNLFLISMFHFRVNLFGCLCVFFFNRCFYLKKNSFFNLIPIFF